MKNRFITALLTLFTIVGMSGCSKNSPSTNNMHDIIVANNEHCVITTNKTQAFSGEKIEVFVTNIEENFSLKEIVVNKAPISGTTFVMPNETAFVDVNLEQEAIKEEYKATIIPSKYAIISLEKEKYEAGELVSVDYECKGNYVLTSFYVDDEPILGTTFEMPSHEVVIRGEFEFVFMDTDWQVSSVASIIAKSFWYLSYQETGIHIRVMVDDRIVCGYDIAESELYRDNIECIMTKKSDSDDITNNSYRIVIPAIGNSFIFKGTNGSWQRNWPSPYQLSYSSTLKHLEDKDGYNGYEINVYISYELLGVTKTEAINNISLAIAMRNATHYGSTVWNSYVDHNVEWDKISTHPIIKEDGSMQLRNI